MVFPIPNHLEAELITHGGPIHAITFSAGLGQYILTGSSDRSIQLHNPQTAKKSDQSTGLIQKYVGHGHEILDLAVSADNSAFISASGDKQVFLWDVETGKILRRWSGHYGRVNTVAFGGQGDSIVCSGSYDATLRIWDRKGNNSRPIQVLEEGKDSISSLAVNDSEILSASIDGRLRMYDIRMGVIYEDYIGHPITSLRRTLDGAAVLLSTLDSTILLLDLHSGKLLQKYSGHVNENYRIRSCLGMKDSIVVSGSEDSYIYIWDLVKGDLIEKLKQPGTSVTSTVAWNGPKSEWASAGTDGHARVWGMA